MPGSINRSNADINQLAILHANMGNQEHVEASHTSIYTRNGRNSEQDANLLHLHQLGRAKGYARGYTGVRDAVAKAVGGTEADRIMQQVLGRDTGRTRGWKTLWMPRKTAISKDQLGRILQLAHKEYWNQVPRRGPAEQQRLRAMVFPNGPQAPAIELKDALQNPELRSYLRGQELHELTPENYSFLDACTVYDNLVDTALQLHAQLADSNGVLHDSDNAVVTMAHNGRYQRADGQAFQNPKFNQLQDAVNAVRLKAHSIRNTFIREDQELTVNLSYHVRNPTLNADIDGADLDDLKTLFGPREQSDDSDNQLTNARHEIYMLVKSGAWVRGKNRLGANYYPVEKSPQNDSKASPNYNLSVSDLAAIKHEMQPDDHLVMVGKKNREIYTKPNYAPNEWHATYNGKPLSKGSNVRHWYDVLTTPYSNYNRNVRINRCKRAVRDALARHVGSKQVATDLMTRLTTGNSAIDKYQLADILEYADSHTDIDTTLQTMASQGRLDEINTTPADDLIEDWVSADEVSSQPPVSRMLYEFADLRAPDLLVTVNKADSLANDLELIVNSAEQGKSRIHPGDLKKLNQRAKTLRQHGPGLSPEAQGLLKKLQKFSSKKPLTPKEISTFRALTNELRNSNRGIAERIRTSFRNHQPYASLIARNSLNHAILNTDFDDIVSLTPRDLIDEGNYPEAIKAFRLHCQGTGKHETAPLKLSRFSEDLHQTWNSDKFAYADNLRSVRKTARQLLADKTVNFQKSEQPLQSDVSKRTPMQILHRLANNKSVEPNELLLLSTAIDNSIQADIDEFRDYATTLHQPYDVIHDTDEDDVEQEAPLQQAGGGNDPIYEVEENEEEVP